MPPSLCWSKAACDCAHRQSPRGPPGYLDIAQFAHPSGPRAVGSVSTVLHTSHMNTVRSQSLNHSHALLSDGDPATRRGVHTSHARSGGRPRTARHTRPRGGPSVASAARVACARPSSPPPHFICAFSAPTSHVSCTQRTQTQMKFTRTRHGAQRRATLRDAARTLSRTSSACHILSSPNSERPRLTLGNAASRPDRHLCRLGNT